MNPSRRAFLKQSGIVAAGISVAPALGLAAATTRLKLSAVDGAVIKFVDAYARRVRLAGEGVLAKLRGRSAAMSVLAEIGDASALDTVWTAAGLPFRGIYAQGNSLSFTHDGAGFAIENLLGEAFAARLDKLQAGGGIRFAHEAMTWNPDNGALYDPFRAADSEALTLVHAGHDLAAAFDTVLRGWIGAEALGLQAGEEFAQLEARVLGGSGGRRTAQGVVKALAQRVASLPVARLKELFRSRIVTTSVPGVTVQDFKVLRAELGSEISDAAIWLALVLETQLTDATTQPSVAESSDRSASDRTRAALSQARQIVTFTAFRRLRSF